MKLVDTPTLHTDLEGHPRLALPPNHPCTRHRLRCGAAADGADSDRPDAPWRVDEIAPAMPWRPDGRPASEVEKTTIIRLAVLRAFEEARRADVMLHRRYYSVSEFRSISGIGLTKTYQLLAEGRLVAFKLDGKTLLCADAADRFLRDLPRASFTTGLRSRAAAEVQRAQA